MKKGNTMRTQTIPPQVVPHKQAAAMLGLTPKALYHKCYRGEGPKHVVRLGVKSRGYLLSEILELIEKNMEREGD